MAKTKTETYEVDEDYLKTVMAGDIPAMSRKEKRQPEIAEEPEVETERESAVGKETPVREVSDSRTRKKREGKGYEAVFLCRRESVQRRQTYVSLELYKKIARFLPVIGGELTVPTYIDNILSQHLEQYKDEINELYEKKTEKPL